MKKTLTLLSVFALCITGFGQVGKVGNPVSWQMDESAGISPIWYDLESIDVLALVAEDQLNAADKSIPLRFASAQTINYNSQTDGRWFNLPSGDRVWQLGLRSSDAYSLSIVFNTLFIPVGGKLYVYNQDRTDYIGPYTNINNSSAGDMLCTMPLQGNSIIIEYFEPYVNRGRGFISMNSAALGYKDLFTLENNADADCLERLNAAAIARDMGNVPYSVFQMLIDNGQRLANGTLINNTRKDGKVYLITAADALVGEPSSWVFSQTLDENCNSFLTCWSSALMGAEVRSSEGAGGVALIEISDQPLDGWNSFLSGWKNTEVTNGLFSVLNYSIAKPEAIATKSGTLSTIAIDQGDVLALGEYDNGGTFEGALGAPLVDANGNVLGVLVGGSAACNNTRVDYFQSLYRSWNNLKSFLDPVNSNSNNLDGMDAVQTSESTAENLIQLFPNPASSWVYVKSILNNPAKQVQVYDAAGRLVVLLSGQSPKLDISDLSAGFYSLRIIRDGDVEVAHLAVK